MQGDRRGWLAVVALGGVGIALWVALGPGRPPEPADRSPAASRAHEVEPHLKAASSAPAKRAEPEPAEGRWVEVTVLDAATDEPLPGIEFWSTGRSPERKGLTDQAGSLRLGPFTKAAVGLSLRTEGWLSDTPIPFVPQGAEDAHVTLRLRRGFAIAGRVFEPGDVPAVGAWVEAYQGNENVTTDTDAEGRFRFPTLAAGTWLLRVRQHFSGPFIKDVEAQTGAEDLIIRLAEALPREIVVEVLAPGGAPVPAFDFAYVTADGGRGSGDWTDPPLTFDPGTDLRWLEIKNPRDADGEPLLLAPASIGPILPGQRRLELRLREGETIAGRVVDAEGKAVSGVLLRAWPLDRGPATGYVAGFHDEATSAADGTSA